MMWKLALAVVVGLLTVASTNGFLFGKSSDALWNGLKTTWGVNPLSSDTYVAHPRTISDAISSGWTEDTEQTCTKSAGHYAGSRYIKDGDTSVMLLFDVNGYIAGMQAGIPKNIAGDYPSPNTFKAWNEEQNMWTITVYFVQPDTICSSGRSKSEYDSEGTGTGLYIQNGPTYSSVMTIPNEEFNMASTQWTKGRCFYTMGLHYWYNLSKDMDCDDFFPVFLLFNSGKLTGFGWAMGADVSGERYEKPPPSVFSQFMVTPPTCLSKIPGGVTTMHVYMVDNPVTSSFC